MYHDLWIKESNITLHSILDIFQSKFNYIGIHYGETFTFHSGYIPITPTIWDKIGDNFFTFHSGYIPILPIQKSIFKNN